MIRNGEEFIKSCAGSVEEVSGKHMHLPPLKAAIGVIFKSVTFDFFNSKLIGLMLEGCWMWLERCLAQPRHGGWCLGSAPLEPGVWVRYTGDLL